MARKNKDKSSTIADFFDRTAANLRGSGNAVSLLSMASCVVCAIAMLAIGVPRLRNYLNERSFIEAGAITVRFVDAPAWFDRTRAAEIRAEVATAVGDGSALDPTRLVAAREALTQSGWFSAIKQVRLDDNGGFLVDAVFRHPFAIVLHANREHLVDENGCRLPADWALGQRPSEPHWISLVNATSPPPGAPGERWAGRDVAAGLELLKTTFGKPWERQIAAIDLSRMDGDGLVLLTTNGGFIMWGYPPDVETTAEPPKAAKLRNLDVLFASTGHIDNGGGRVLDLRTDVPSVRLVSDEAPR